MMRLQQRRLCTLFASCLASVYALRHLQQASQEASLVQTTTRLVVEEFDQQQQRRNNALAKFSIPIFAFSWSSPNLLQGDVREDLHLLGSTVAGPLSDIVEDFVYQSFRIQLARLATDESVPEMVQTLRMVQFQTTVVYNERNKEEDHAMLRQRRELQASSTHLDFYAQFQGWAYFVQTSDPNDMPTAEYMSDTLGQWRESFMVEDYVILMEELHKSDDPVLKNLGNLVVINNVQPGDYPYAPETPVGAAVPAESSSHQNNMNDLWLSFFVVLGAVTLVGALLLARPYVLKRHRQLDAHQGAFPHVGDDATASVSLPGRGEGSEGEEIDPVNMEESDLWLQQHRPDLFRALRRAESFRNNPPANGTDGIMNDSQNTKSTRLQFLFGGMFVRRNTAGPLPSVSLASRDSQTMDEAEEDVSDSTPSWWQKLANSLQGQTLACDEDPSQYDFAFSDFPRHDGTPCLIFSETETGPALIRVMSSESADNQTLSNEDFKRQLSMHDLHSGLANEEDLDGSSEFTNKLERLIAMRHRHYEKERIIQKARQARDQERLDEARQRELKLRRHEMELDLEEIEASLTPRALSRKNLMSTNSYSFETDADRSRKKHRVIMSDSNYFSAVDENSQENAGTVELATIGGPSLRHDSEDAPPPPPRGSSHGRTYSDSSPCKLMTVDRPKPHPLTAQPAKHRRSHRRSFSHGTQETEEKKIDHVGGHKRNGSNADDVMAFGIAAYTNFT